MEVPPVAKALEDFIEDSRPLLPTDKDGSANGDNVVVLRYELLQNIQRILNMIDGYWPAPDNPLEILGIPTRLYGIS